MKTILVIDDEPLIRNLLIRYIKLQGYFTLEAASGAEALELMRGHREHVDLAIIDQTLKDGKGVDVAARITAMKPEIRILLISGGDERDILAQVPNGCRMCGFLQKPFDRGLLVERIEGIFERQSARRA